VPLNTQYLSFSADSGIIPLTLLSVSPSSTHRFACGNRNTLSGLVAWHDEWSCSVLRHYTEYASPNVTHAMSFLMIIVVFYSRFNMQNLTEMIYRVRVLSHPPYI
jgi:hypothetical protein